MRGRGERGGGREVAKKRRFTYTKIKTYTICVNTWHSLTTVTLQLSIVAHSNNNHSPLLY